MSQIPASIRNLFLDILKRDLTIREGDETRKISTKEAVLRAHVTTAIKGNALAQRDVRQFAMQCEQEAEEAHWERYHVWAFCKERNAALIAAGHPADEILPHPDDIILHHDGKVTFNGPISLEDKERIDELILRREACLMIWAWEDRLFARDKSDNQTEKTSVFCMNALCFDAELPERYRWDNATLTVRYMYYDRLPKKELLPLAQEAWLAAFGKKIELWNNTYSLEEFLRKAGHSSLEAWLAHIHDNPISHAKLERMLWESEQAIAKWESQNRKRRNPRSRTHKGDSQIIS